VRTQSTTAEKLHLPVSERDHIQGPTNALVTLVEYGDYECPACGQAYWIIKKLQESLAGRIRFVFRNFPLTNIHPHAEHAAEAAEAATAQRKFWEMHDILFENQSELEDGDLGEYANGLGLDVERLMTEIENGNFKVRVREDFQSGVRSGVNGTPTFFINGLRYDGAYDVESLLAALAQAAK
jgi:protein-disulfide isomerase